MWWTNNKGSSYIYSIACSNWPCEVMSSRTLGFLLPCTLVSVAPVNSQVGPHVSRFSSGCKKHALGWRSQGAHNCTELTFIVEHFACGTLSALFTAQPQCFASFPSWACCSVPLRMSSLLLVDRDFNKNSNKCRKGVWKEAECNSLIPAVLLQKVSLIYM